ncbi:MAG: hypothetical protein ACRD9R_03880 [Pyrinomonadaceae bacterium]
MSSYSLQEELSHELRRRVAFENEQERLLAEYQEVNTALVKRASQLLEGLVLLLLVSLLTKWPSLLLIIFTPLVMLNECFILPHYKVPSVLMLWRDLRAVKRQIANCGEVIKATKNADLASSH